jgi:hypothetical protein
VEEWRDEFAFRRLRRVLCRLLLVAPTRCEARRSYTFRERDLELELAAFP